MQVSIKRCNPLCRYRSSNHIAYYTYQYYCEKHKECANQACITYKGLTYYVKCHR